ncbi:MAG: hypothetical protein OEW87_04095 [Flavobacteriaceae bacterium]|nr:hypothetical protein [Flavobacteriaceae bacterium]
MNNKLIILLLISIFFTFSCKSKDIVKINKTKDISLKQIQYAKDFVFCKCLYSRLDIETIKRINKVDYSFGYYWDVYEGNPLILDSIAKAYAKSIPKSQIDDLNNKIPLISSCLEFYRSKELDSLIRNLSR